MSPNDPRVMSDKVTRPEPHISKVLEYNIVSGCSTPRLLPRPHSKQDQTLIKALIKLFGVYDNNVNTCILQRPFTTRDGYGILPTWFICRNQISYPGIFSYKKRC